MDHRDNLYSSDEYGDSYEQDRKTNSTKWLKSSNASLASLQHVKPVSVYNFGLSNPKDLKATHLLSNRSSSVTNLVAEPVLQTIGSQKTAWGSNGSIPDLLKNQRPGSAKTSSRRHPPHVKKTRPQSAKEEVKRTSPGIAVKGARYDPSGRPPKSFSSTTGWIGPPAGMKFTDPTQDDIKSDFLSDRLLQPPSSPAGTPRYHIDVDLQSNLTEEDTDSPRLRYTHGEPQRTPSPPYVPPAPIHLMLPSMYDDVEEDEDVDELNTDRLLLMAEEHIQADKKAETVNDFIEKVSSANHSANDLPGFTYTYLNGRTSQESKLEIHADGDSEVVSWEKEDVNDSFEFSDFSGTPNNSPRSEPEIYHPPPLEKVSVKFSEEKNVTINITPRNTGHKVSELHANKKKNVDSSENGELKSLLSVNSARTEDVPTSSRKKTVSLTEMKHENKSVRTLPNNKSYTRSDKPSNDNLEFKFTSQDNARCERSLSNKPKTAPLSRPSTPLTSVTVAYCDLDDNKKRRKRYKGLKSEKDVITLVQQVQASDSDDEKNEDMITPNKLESWMPTKTTSQPSQNYYELSRKVQKPNSKALKKEKLDAELVKGAPLVKTIKTIELDESGNDLKETKTQSFIDTCDQISAYHEKERQQREATRVRTKQRPASEMLPRHPKIKIEKEEVEKKTETGQKKAHRPSSAPTRRRPSSGLKDRKQKEENKISQHTTKEEITDEEENVNVTQNGNEAIYNVNNIGESVVMETEEDELSDISYGHESGSDVEIDLKTVKDLEIEKIIEKHLGKPSQTMDLLSSEKVPPKSNKMQTKPTQEKICGRKLTAHSHSHCNCPSESKQESKKVSTMTVQLPKNDRQINKVYGAYARRKSAPPLRTVNKSKPTERPRTAKPVYITSKNPDDIFETEENIECQNLQAKLAANGVNVKAETLERALYPPSGRTKYYEINAQLPNSTSSNLLSHPREWLPIEYRQLKLAEKALNRANEMMYKQRMAEDRKARLTEIAKKKVKGKKRAKSKEKKKDDTKIKT